MDSFYQPNPQYSYVEAPAPPPARPDFPYSPEVQYADPASPMIFPVSPNISPVPSRDSSRNRRSTLSGGDPFITIPERGRDRPYYSNGHLAIGQQGVSRSNSERSRTRPVYVEVARSGARGRRSPSQGTDYYYSNSKVYKEGSTYSNSSYGSQTHSRSHSKVGGRHSRSSSCDSCDSADPTGYEVGFHHGPDGHHHNKELASLTKHLQNVELQLKQVKAESESKKQAEENARIEKLRTEEIERKVAEKLMLQRKQEMEAAERRKRQEEEERRRIEDAAKRLLEEKERAAREREQEEKRKKEEIDARVRAGLMAMQPQPPPQQPQQPARRTYTKFSKIHLCKEALDERQISYTEEHDSFLVHRAVDKQEQNYLWNRTKEIRGYYRQIQEAADKAPTVPGPDGGFVKYVQIAGQPYPMALPVTIMQTPGGGQTARVDPIKIKWSDIFRAGKV
ncbi:unnamed protein product [Tuber melanosporum]|uniref:(Perigord truffle) hypothetical protein n=1 Tax=Tuber melanosporum (strain Mel28) TaxID=656061 RepID=D5GA09_TUBMM|nr:uncharacterized protein GSTUM_00003484001 [Tuber melanosporum]CAZ81352.1 unnamed protein product [Tuber melanosporum]